MSNQDSDFFQEPSHHLHQEPEGIVIDAAALNLLAKLHLNSAAADTLRGGRHQPATTSSMDNNQCSRCGTSKRQSPSSLSSFQEPSSKRANVLPPTSTTASGGDHRILGFSEIPLPPIFSSASASSSLALRRTISDPITSPGANKFSVQGPISVGSFLSNQLPETSAPKSVHKWPFKPLYRSISDPLSGSYQVVTTTTPPLPPPPARKVMAVPRIEGSGLNMKEESPNTKRRLKRMKDRLTEMRKWWNEVIEEEEQETESADEDNLPTVSSSITISSENYDEAEMIQVTENGEGPCEEAVWVERNGDCLILHFKCPCGKGYQILLSGKNCYYKLTAF